MTYFCPSCSAPLDYVAYPVSDNPKYASLKPIVVVDFKHCACDCTLRNNTLAIDTIHDNDELTGRYGATINFSVDTGEAINSLEALYV